MSTINYFLAILFLAFAAMQINDVDRLIWIPVYGLTSVLCFLAAKERFFPSFNYSLMAVFLLMASFLFFRDEGVLFWYFNHSAEDITQKITTGKPWIERTRDFFGLLICLFAIGLSTGWYYTLDHSERKPTGSKKTFIQGESLLNSQFHQSY